MAGGSDSRFNGPQTRKAAKAFQPFPDGQTSTLPSCHHTSLTSRRFKASAASVASALQLPLSQESQAWSPGEAGDHNDHLKN